MNATESLATSSDNRARRGGILHIGLNEDRRGSGLAELLCQSKASNGRSSGEDEALTSARGQASSDRLAETLSPSADDRDRHCSSKLDWPGRLAVARH
jgi:hypothetical protein